MTRSPIALMLFALVFLLMACSVLGTGDTPESGAKEWFQSLADSDGLKLDDRTCSIEKKNLQQGTLWVTAFGVLGQSLLGQNVKVDVSDLTFRTVSSHSTSADVQVTGKIRSALGLSVQSQQIDQTLRMSKEDNKWKYCGEGSPSGGFAISDVQNLLPHPDEVDASLQKSEFNPQTWDETKLSTELRQAGLVGGGQVEFLAPESVCTSWCKLDGAVYLLRDSTSATEWLKSSPLSSPDPYYQAYGASNCSLIGTVGGPHPGNGITCQSDTNTLIAWYWQDNNAVLFLVINARRSKLTLEDVQALAEKIESRLH